MTGLADVMVTKKKSSHPLAGKRVISRAPGSGVHIGTLVRVSKKYGHILTNVQRIWNWRGALDTCALAATGPSQAKVSPPVPGTSSIPDGRELYPLSDAAEQAFDRIGVWSA